MILATGRDSRDYRPGFVICLRSIDPLEKVLHRARVVPKTYGADLVERLYDQVFNRSLDLKADFARYYSREYDSFFEYLDRRYAFGPSATNTLGKVADRCAAILYMTSTWSIFDEDEGIGVLASLLGMRKPS